MAAAICLFCFCTFAQLPCEVAPTLVGYVSRLVGADDVINSWSFQKGLTQTRTIFGVSDIWI
jgi:hypothetical protein